MEFAPRLEAVVVDTRKNIRLCLQNWLLLRNWIDALGASPLNPLLSLNDASLLLLIVSPWLGADNDLAGIFYHVLGRPARQKCELCENHAQSQENFHVTFPCEHKKFLFLFFAVSFFIIKTKIYINIWRTTFFMPSNFVSTSVMRRNREGSRKIVKLRKFCEEAIFFWGMSGRIF